MATVVLLGWLGAKDRHLAKYADMYEEMGVSSVRVIGAELCVRASAEIVYLGTPTELLLQGATSCEQHPFYLWIHTETVFFSGVATQRWWCTPLGWHRRVHSCGV